MHVLRRVLPFTRPLWPTLALCLLVPSPAKASLTESEKAQVRSFLSAARLDTVSRTRSLVARPDLTSEEATQVLCDALRMRSFDEQAENYVAQLLLGPASQASRASLAGPVTRALLARAEQILVSFRIDPSQALDNSPASYDELMRIHGLVREKLLTPKPASLGSESLRDISAAYREHFENAHFQINRAASGRLLSLRDLVATNLAQAAATVSPREEVSRWLGLVPSSQSFFIRTGIVVDDAGRGPDVRVAEVLRVAQAVPSAFEGLSLIVIDKGSQPSFGDPSSTLSIRTSLGTLAPRRDGLFPTIIQSSAPEQALYEAAFATSLRKARILLNQKPILVRVAEATMASAAGKGESAQICGSILSSSLDTDISQSSKPAEPATLFACASSMLLTDAPRTIDLAIMRWLSGPVEPLEQMLLGMRLLASTAEPNASAQIAHDRDGELAFSSIPLTLDTDLVRSFSIDGHAYEVERGADGLVISIKRDGARPRLADLRFARVPLIEGDSWSGAGRRWVRLGGKPELGLLEDGRVIMESAGDSNSAVYTETPGPDQLVSANFRIERGSAGLIAGGSTAEGGFQGVVLVVGCKESICAARLVQIANGVETDLAQQLRVPTQDIAGFSVKLHTKGNVVTASVGTLELKGQLAQPLPPGHAGLMVRAGGRTTVGDFACARSPTSQPPAAKPKRTKR